MHVKSCVLRHKSTVLPKLYTPSRPLLLLDPSRSYEAFGPLFCFPLPLRFRFLSTRSYPHFLRQRDCGGQSECRDQDGNLQNKEKQYTAVDTLDLMEKEREMQI